MSSPLDRPTWATLNPGLLMGTQVAAYCNGRGTVTEYDVLLLQHVLWQRPDNADRINDWVVSQLSADDGTKQVWTERMKYDKAMSGTAFDYFHRYLRTPAALVARRCRT